MTDPIPLLQHLDKVAAVVVIWVGPFVCIAWMLLREGRRER